MLDQELVFARFAQEADRPRLQGLLADSFFGKRRDEDHGCVIATHDQ